MPMTKVKCRMAVLLAAFSIGPLALAQPSQLQLYLLGHQIGAEQYTLTDSSLSAHFEYLDRATKIALDTTLGFARDFTPLSFESHGRSYRIFPVDASVPKASGAANTFTLDGVAPLSAQGLLVRYWLTHGRPAAITLEPSGDRVTIRESTHSMVVGHSGLPPLRQFTIDG